MAKEKDRTLPDRFEGASRGRWRSVGAAIAAGLGVFSVWGHFEDGVPESLYVACSLLAAGIALGAVLGFAPSGTRLDFRSGTYRAWYGWALPWLGRRGRLDEIERIDLETRRTGGRRFAELVHVLSARRPGQGPLEIAWIWSYGAARRAAESLAARLGVPFSDATSGVGVTRDPADLDRPLHLRGDRRRGELRIPPLPEGSRIAMDVDRQARLVRFRLHRPGVTLDHLAPLVLSVGLAVAAMILPGRGHRADVERGAPLQLLLGIAVTAILFAAIGSASRETCIEAGAAGLRVRWRSWWRSLERKLAREVIEELLVGRVQPYLAWYSRDFFPQAVLALTDRETITLGGHLRPVEQHWLRDALEEALAWE